MDTSDLDPKIPAEEPANLKFLRRLVTILTATMIAGVVLIIVLIVMRFRDVPPVLPEQLKLPDGADAISFTQGPDWYAIVTDKDNILIYDRITGRLIQTLVIE